MAQVRVRVCGRIELFQNFCARSLVRTNCCSGEQVAREENEGGVQDKGNGDGARSVCCQVDLARLAQGARTNVFTEARMKKG